jgi:hypothetical protein
MAVSCMDAVLLSMDGVAVDVVAVGALVDLACSAGEHVVLFCVQHGHAVVEMPFARVCIALQRHCTAMSVQSVALAWPGDRWR